MKTLNYMIIALACLVMVSCQPEPDPVHLEVNGTGTLSMGYSIDNTWEKMSITDHWEMDADLNAGDTIQLAAYGNGAPVTIAINEKQLTIPGDGYGKIIYTRP